MSDNLSQVLRNLTNGMDKKNLSKAMPEFKKIISTPEGQRLVSAIKASDKDSLAVLLGNLEKSSSPADALKQASENPGILENLTKLLNKED